MSSLFFNSELRNFLMLLAVGLLLIFYGICAYRNGRRARNLQKCCTVPVDAVCISNGCRRTGFKTDGKFNVLYRFEYNCTYRYEYQGRIYTANNGVWSGMNEFNKPREGDRVRLLIDPRYPDREIFDPIANSDVSNSVTGAVLFIGMSVFVALIPVFQYFNII